MSFSKITVVAFIDKKCHKAHIQFSHRAPTFILLDSVHKYIFFFITIECHFHDMHCTKGLVIFVDSIGPFPLSLFFAFLSSLPTLPNFILNINHMKNNKSRVSMRLPWRILESL